MADYFLRNRVVRFEAPADFDDTSIFRREVAPHLLAISGVAGGGTTPLDQMLDDLAADLDVPRLERGAELLIAFDDGKDERVATMIEQARKRRLPYTVVMYGGDL